MFCHRVQSAPLSLLCFEYPPPKSLNTCFLMRIDRFWPINHLNAICQREKKFKAPNPPPLLFAYFPLGSQFREKRHLYDVSRASFSCGKCEQTMEKAPFGVDLQNHFTDFEMIQPLGCELWILVLPQIGLVLFIRLFQ